MAISFGESRSYGNSLTAFQSLLKGKGSSPSLNNLYAVEFSQPRVLGELYGQRLIPGGTASQDLFLQLNHYCSEIGTPSRNVTTGSVNNIGSAYKYATGQSHSEVTATFIMPRDTRTYTFFERWMMAITSDAEQYVELMENYTCSMKIFKYERGQGKKVFYKESDLIKEQANDADAAQKRGYYHENEITGCWVLNDVFPINLSQVQVTSGKASFTTFTVGFTYRNFRYYPNDRNVDLRNKTELSQNPVNNFLESLNSLAQNAFNNPQFGSSYAEFLTNQNFDFSSVAKPNFAAGFNTDLAASFAQPPGTPPLNFFGNTAPDNL